MSAPRQYRKKPVVIEAVEFKGELTAGVIIGWTMQGDQHAEFVQRGHEHPMRYDRECDRSNGHTLDDAPSFLVIPTLEGNHRADLGDFVIRGIQGEFYPCKPDIFAETYDPVDPT